MRPRRDLGLGPPALLRLLALALACATASAPSVSFGADGAPADANRVLLGVAAPDLSDSVRRDFELSITRGLRFGGLDVATDPVPSGAAPGVVACGDAGCFRQLGAARGAGLVARAIIDSAAVRARESTKRNYSMKIQVFSARSGEPLVERGTTCEACASEVAAHLGYLIAMDVGQKLNDVRRPIAAAAAPRPAPSPAAPPPRVVDSAPEARPVTVTTSAKASAPALEARPLTVTTSTKSDATAAGVIEHRDPAPGRSRARKIGVGVLGGLGLAAVTTGTVLWARGRQSTCSDLPASACGRTYNDAPTGWLLTGLGAAAIAGALVWWMVPGPHETSGRPSPVAIVPGGLVLSGWF
jgi:hypothetical protein